MSQVPLLPALHWVALVQLHTPLEQEKPAGQAWPQAPQLVALVSRSTHWAGLWQQVCVGPQPALPLHLHTSLPVDLAHTSPGLQVVPLHLHRPVGPSQVPLAPLVLQRLLSLLHEHCAPAEQTNPPAAPCVRQLLPQPPQSVLLVAVVSHPSSAFAGSGRVQLA